MTKDEAMKRLIRDDTEHGVEYYRADEVDVLMAEQPAQHEPVAWVCEGSEPDEKHGIDYWPGDVDDLPIGTQLYTSPPQRTWVGLTDEKMADYLGDRYHSMTENELEFFRLGEAAHGIKENT